VRSYGDALIVGGESHPAGSDDATPERYRRLEEFARAHWDVAEITHRWSAQDPTHYDHLPLIGSYRPGSSHLWVSAAFMKWGFASATFAAMIIADRLAGRANEWADTFSPTRLSARSLHEVAQLGAKFTTTLVGDRLRPPWPRKQSPRCTHMGCLLRFNSAERTWDCPCHGSRFDVDGAVLEGPAVHPLENP
jgi:hypothetical protein